MTPDDRDLAAQLLARTSYISFAWIDEELVVQSTFGPLSSTLQPGDGLCAATPALFGLEQQIKALQATPHETLELPNVTTVADKGSKPAAELRRSVVPGSSEILVVRCTADRSR